MKKELLIILSKELKEQGLKPSKNKVELLINYDEKQVELFINLIESKFINQSNLNYVIEEISKIDVSKCDVVPSVSILEELRFINPDLNKQVLKFILNDLKHSSEKDAQSNVVKLGVLANHSNSYFLTYPKVMEVLLNKKLTDNGFIKSVIENYSRILSLENNEEKIKGFIERLNNIILDSDILNNFIAKCKHENKNYIYAEMLDCFVDLDIEVDKIYFNKCYRLISDIARNKKIINWNSVIHILYLCRKKYGKFNDFGLLESILLTTDKWDKAEDIIDIISLVEQGNDDNLAILTKNVYDSKYNKDDLDNFYNNLIYSIKRTFPSGINPEMLMSDINDFIIPLLSNRKFMKYIFKNSTNEKSNYILFALLSGRDYLFHYSVIANSILNFNITFETYEKLLNSFNINFNAEQLQAKALIYSWEEVLNNLCNDSSILDKLNYITEDHKFQFCHEECCLLTNNEFLNSDFFRNFYSKLVHSSSTKLRNMYIDYRTHFFKILSTFDFNDPNLIFYMQSLLNTYDKVSELESIYEYRKMADGLQDLTDIKDLFYGSISSNNEDMFNQYIKMIEAAPEDFDIKPDTKIIYQKKIGKKKD